MKARSILVLLTLFVLTGCGTLGSSAQLSQNRRQAVRTSAPRFKHVFLIVLENKEYNPAQDPPFLTALATQGAAAVDYYAIAHPSLPNYISLLSGSTFGIQSDATQFTLHGTTLVDQLEHVGLSWKAYMEDMPYPCFAGDQANGYVKRHNPFEYFASIRTVPARCNRIVPFGQLSQDLTRHTVPNFVWITPTLCHDGHDCGNDAVDAFLSSTVSRITSSPAYHDRGVLFITHDEGTTDGGCCRDAQGGHVSTVYISDQISHGPRLTIPTSHYSLLRTIEDGFGLPRLRAAACPCTNSLEAAWSS
jgi:phosphatidylinositol-3-phosphatase